MSGNSFFEKPIVIAIISGIITGGMSMLGVYLNYDLKEEKNKKEFKREINKEKINKKLQVLDEMRKVQSNPKSTLDGIPYTINTIKDYSENLKVQCLIRKYIKLWNEEEQKNRVNNIKLKNLYNEIANNFNEEIKNDRENIENDKKNYIKVDENCQEKKQ